VHWYSPKTRSTETVTASCTDEEAKQMLRSGPDSGAFLSEYKWLRDEGMDTPSRP
jgi:hypothetical protein